MAVSRLKTLAAQHRTRMTAIAAQSRAPLMGPDGTSRVGLQVGSAREGKRPIKVQCGGLPWKRQAKAILHERPPPPRLHSTEVERRVRAGVGEACGSTEHPEGPPVRTLKDIRGRGGRGGPAWRRHRAALQRKTRILCAACHHKLHAGQCDANCGRRYERAACLATCQRGSGRGSWKRAVRQHLAGCLLHCGRAHIDLLSCRFLLAPRGEHRRAPRSQAAAEGQTLPAAA
jgi:hypothetical protein